jgi:ATP-dependent exoDNAse (exonuclease V) beta subunit/inactivated superfamily I helicase
LVQEESTDHIRFVAPGEKGVFAVSSHSGILNFLGWDRPILHSAIDWLVEHYPPDGVRWRLSGLRILLPSGYATRKMRELLAGRAEKEEWLLEPPHLMTVGHFQEKLYVVKKPIASRATQIHAWLKALRDTPAEQLASVFPDWNPEAAFLERVEYAQILFRLYDEISEDLIDFGVVAGEVEQLEERRRWSVLQKVHENYLRTLDRLELWDRQAARRFALKEKEVRTDHDLVVLGAIDLSKSHQDFLQAVRGRVHVLIAAPEAWRDGFDSLGILKSDVWTDLKLTVDRSILRIASGPKEAAEEVCRVLAQLPEATSTQDVTLGVPDLELIDPIHDRLDRLGVRTCSALGSPLKASDPFQLLQKVAAYLQQRTWESFAALVRHASVFDYLTAQRGIPPNFLQSLDDYYQRTLVSRVDLKEWPRGDDPRCSELASVAIQTVREVDRWLDGLRFERLPIARWAERLRGMWEELDERPEGSKDSKDSGDSEETQRLLECYRALANLCSELASVPPPLQESVTLRDALQWLEKESEGEMIKPPPDPSALEMLSWLDLVWDDADVLLLTGFHDGVVPHAIASDGFLTDSLRKKLFLQHDARRYARDAYYLQILLHARKHLTILYHQKDRDGTPLLPSRLLLAVPLEEIAERVTTLLSPPPESPTAVADRWIPDPERTRIDIPQPKVDQIHLPESISVTAFRDYLACPYRFYLQRVIRLQEVSDESSELPPNLFGDMVHYSLDRWARSKYANSIDPKEITDSLVHHLNQWVKTNLGRDLYPAIQLQIEQARMRLEAFAEIQAARRGQGWVIKEVEFSIDRSHAIGIPSDRSGLKIHGRIDRIDYHEETNRWAIWDYKTSETPKDPAKAHFLSNQWRDLQLPLYRHLAFSITNTLDVDLGYIQLPKSLEKIQFQEAKFQADQLAEADRKAIETLQNIAEKKFWPHQEARFPDSDPFRSICQTDVMRSENVVSNPEAHSSALGRRRAGTANGPEITRSVSLAQQRETDWAPEKVELGAPRRAGPFPSEWFEPLMIRASAGTGKTYQLALRVIRLLVANQSPDSILATTFTRKAAGEILVRILRRMAEAAKDRSELEKLRKDLGGMEIESEEIAYHLARTCRMLHRFRVGTLDSFFGQLARSFAFELGLPPGWRMADDFTTERMHRMAAQILFAHPDRAQLKSLLGMLFKGETTRDFLRQVLDEMVGCLRLYQDSEREAWDSLRVPSAPDPKRLQEMKQLFAGATIGHKTFLKSRDALLVQFENQDWPSVLQSTLLRNLDSETPKFSGKPYTAEVIDALMVMRAEALHRELTNIKAKTIATYDLLHLFATHLERLQSESRTFTFDTLARKLAKWMDRQDIPDLARRMDQGVNHLLLDEFQDTAPVQWRILEPLAHGIESLIEHGHVGSIFCVGDTKQAIYGWRGGESVIFDAFLNSLRKKPKCVPLNTSRRSSPVIIDLVNALFQHLDHFPRFEEGEVATAQWQQDFPQHTTARDNLPGYVQVFNGPQKTRTSYGSQSSEDSSDGTDPAENEDSEDLIGVAAGHVAELHRQAPDRTIAVLFRRNADVATMIHRLRVLHIDASQEGGNPLTDSAAVNLLLSLFLLADHPGHSIAAFQIASAPWDSTTPPPWTQDPLSLSKEIRRQVTTDGYGRTVAAWADRIAPACDERDQIRLQQLVYLAVRFDEQPTARLRDFVRYVESERVDYPKASPVRVMTIHQSKGLEFDAVFLPSLHQNFRSASAKCIAEYRDRTEKAVRVMRYVPKEMRSCLGDGWPEVYEDHETHEWTGGLSVLYVAMTRARQALYLYALPSEKPLKNWGSVLHACLLKPGEEHLAAEPMRVITTRGNRDWYRIDRQTNPPLIREGKEPQAPWTVSLRTTTPEEYRRHLVKKTPSALHRHHRGIVRSAFQERSEDAARGGTLIHRWMEQVLWIDEFQWDRKMAQQWALDCLAPEEMGLVPMELWMSRMENYLASGSLKNALSKERYRHWLDAGLSLSVSRELDLLHKQDQYLVQGTIDRLVVGSKGGKAVQAEILDYKTDRLPDGMPLEEWTSDRQRVHQPQLTLYRQVVSQQLAIPESSVACTLVLLSGDLLASI